MKKLLIFTITAAMLLSLVACAQSAKPDASLDTPAHQSAHMAQAHMKTLMEIKDREILSTDVQKFTV